MPTIRLGVLALATAVLIVPASAQAAITMDCQTFAAAGGASASASFSLSGVTGEPIVGAFYAASHSCAAGFIACGNGWLPPLDVATRAVHVAGIRAVYPNPGTARFAIWFSLPVRSRAELRVFDSAGRLVRTLFDGWMEAGDHRTDWAPVRGATRAGVYFARLRTDQLTETRPLVLIP